MKILRIKGRTEAERQVLQASVDGDIEFFRGLLLEAQPSTAPWKTPPTAQETTQHTNNNNNISHWWRNVFDVTHGCGVLHWAAGMGHLALVQLLLSSNNNVNQPAMGKSQGRTALHYACRNGHLDVVQCLVETYQADLQPVQVRHGVTPFHLAVWRNHLDICQYLVETCGVDAGQPNVFGCTAIHWLGLVPKQQPCGSGNLLKLAQWLVSQLTVDQVRAKQKQGHSVLHKAAWGGHLELCRYFHETFGLYDDSPDDAGNYAADLADMAGHTEVARYLRNHCSEDTVVSCNVLGLTVDQRYDRSAIQRAYYRAAKQRHPDRQPQQQTLCDNDNTVVDEFCKLTHAYRHLTEEGGVGSQRNPKHTLPLLLTASMSSSSSGHPENNDSLEKDDRFASQLNAVVLEYGTKGLDISNLRKKWNQLWPCSAFPVPPSSTSLKAWLLQHAHHVVTVRTDEATGITRIHATPRK